MTTPWWKPGAEMFPDGAHRSSAVYVFSTPASPSDVVKLRSRLTAESPTCTTLVHGPSSTVFHITLIAPVPPHPSEKAICPCRGVAFTFDSAGDDPAAKHTTSASTSATGTTSFIRRAPGGGNGIGNTGSLPGVDLKTPRRRRTKGRPAPQGLPREDESASPVHPRWSRLRRTQRWAHASPSSTIFWMCFSSTSVSKKLRSDDTR